MFNDLMENIEWFFNLHDKNKDGYLTKDEVLTLSESLLVCRVVHSLETSSLMATPSSSSVSRLVTRILELLAGSCQTLSNMGTHSYLDLKEPILKTTLLLWNQISRTSTLLRKFFPCSSLYGAQSPPF